MKLKDVSEYLRQRLMLEVIATGVTKEVMNKAFALVNQMMDGDAPGKPGVEHPVTDTPPSIHEWPAGVPERCSTLLFADFPSGQKIPLFLDRTDLMSYFWDCFHNFAPPGKPFQPAWAPIPDNDTFATDPAAAALGKNMYVFAGKDDWKIYMNWAQAGHAYSSWVEVPGNGSTYLAPAVAAWNSQLYLFVRGLDGRIYVNSATPN